jgi:nucleoside-diphosphate-sugar epimerase
MIFVTGGTGLLGSHLLYHLSQQDVSIRAIFRDQSKINLTFKIFQFYSPENAETLFSKIEWVNCDVLDVVTLEDYMQGSETVYHCAAIVSFARKDFFKMMKVNRRGTANIVNLGLDLGIKKLCFVSSTSAVCADIDHPENPLVEKNKWVQTPETSGYAISKYSSEKEVWRGIEEGLDAIIVNPSMIISPGNWDESSLKILRTISSSFKFYTSGSNAFVDARDVASVMVHLMQSDIKNERYLVTGTNISFKSFFDKVAMQLGVKAPSILAGPFLSNVACNLAWFVSLFTGKRTLTKDSVRSAQAKTIYSSEKLLHTLENFQFRSIDETIENAVKGRIK